MCDSYKSMKKSGIIFASIGLVIILRVISIIGQNKLAVGTNVRITIPSIDYPEYTDSKTIIRRGDWEVIVKGYTFFIPGDVLVLEGVVDDRGRIVEAEVMSINSQKIYGIDYLLILISRFRHWSVLNLQRTLPEPQASLAIGILLGVKREMSRDFYEQLVETGTLHIIAASGYNVSVVGTVLMAISAMFLGKYYSLVISILGIVGYIILAGGSPSIVRAGVMGILTLIGVGLGRQTEARRLLWIASIGMILVKPELIFDVGFQLSVSATVGLLYIGEIIKSLTNKLSSWRPAWTEEYLIPTLAATIATAPVIYWHFGRLSLIGVFVNMLILPVVPLIMLLTTLTLVFAPISYLLYVPLWWVIWVIRMFG